MRMRACRGAQGSSGKQLFFKLKLMYEVEIIKPIK